MSDILPLRTHQTSTNFLLQGFDVDLTRGPYMSGSLLLPLSPAVGRPLSSQPRLFSPPFPLSPFPGWHCLAPPSYTTISGARPTQPSYVLLLVASSFAATTTSSPPSARVALTSSPLLSWGVLSPPPCHSRELAPHTHQLHFATGTSGTDARWSVSWA
jgi:hypothetical protein